MHVLSVLVLFVIPLLLVLAAVPFVSYYGLCLCSRWNSSHARAAAYREAIRPTASWMVSFRDQNGRLPRLEEVQAYARTNSPKFPVMVYYENPNWPELRQVNWRTGVDFMISVSVDDWNCYRNSWDKRESELWRD